jgi:enoyl-CoA hydratase/carnithine racemase
MENAMNDATAEAEPILLVHADGPKATLTLNRPRQRNSLSEALMREIGNQIALLSNDPSVKVIVIAANGPAFCAGHDLKELTAHRADDDRGRDYYTQIMGQCSAMMQAIVNCPKPVIARVHGIATAAGCQLVASCDLAVAADTTRFATPGVNIGLFCSTPMVALSRNIPRKQAMEMLLMGEMIDAPQAENWGLINRSVPEDKLDETVASFTDKLVQKSALTISIGKPAFYNQLEMDLASAYTYASDVMVRNMLAFDAEEGINAFIEKRDPVWEDR